MNALVPVLALLRRIRLALPPRRTRQATFAPGSDRGDRRWPACREEFSGGAGCDNRDLEIDCAGKTR